MELMRENELQVNSLIIKIYKILSLQSLTLLVLNYLKVFIIFAENDLYCIYLIFLK